MSFNDSPVDQFPWERSAYPVPGDTTYGLQTRPAVQVSLVDLIKHFVGHAHLTDVLGNDFMELYPSVIEDLSELDAGWKYLALGLPRGIPFFTTPKAQLARRRLASGLRSVFATLESVSIDPNKEHHFPCCSMECVKPLFYG